MSHTVTANIAQQTAKFDIIHPIKDAAVWAGKTIKSGFSHLASSIRNIWAKVLPFLSKAASETVRFLRTGPGVAIVGATAGFSLLELANRVKDKDKHPKIKRIALQAGAVACFIGTGIGLGFAIAKGPSALLY